MADGVWKGVYPKVFGRSRQFFYPTTPSMRKVDDGGKTGKKQAKIMLLLVATNAVASQ